MRCFILALALCISSATQAEQADSLRTLLRKTFDKSKKTEFLIQLFEYYEFVNADTARMYIDKAVKTAERAGNKGLMADAWMKSGWLEEDAGNNQHALKCYRRARAYALESGDRKVLSKVYNALGSVYKVMGEYDESYIWYTKCLKIDEALGDEDGIGAAYNNIGEAFRLQQLFQEARKYYRRAIVIKEKINNADHLATIYMNLSLTYEENEQTDSAMFYLRRALKFGVSSRNKATQALCLNNIGSMFNELHRPDSALVYFNKAMQLVEEIGYSSLLVNITMGMGGALMTSGQYKKAIPYFLEALKRARENDAGKEMIMGYLTTSDCYFNLGQYKLSAMYKDSGLYLNTKINREEVSKSIIELSRKYELEKKEKEILSKQKEIELAKKERRITEQQNRNRILLLGGGLASLGIIVSFLVYNVRRKRKTNVELTNQNLLIQRQKAMVEQKNTEIVDSINYAKRIQEALLKEEQHVNDSLPEHFVLFKPRDIVSGDFYWATEIGTRWYVAAADCTGHGVPGAFLTMLGTAYLNEIVNTENHISPAAILDKLRNRFVKELSQTGDATGSKDGMDISLLAIDSAAGEIEWAGANNPLWVKRRKATAMEEIKPDKQPIGYYDVMLPFTNHTMKLEKGDTLFIFSDGLADQFGGEKGKKFKYAQLKEILLQHANESMENVKQTLNTRFEAWKGEYEQVDDVCVIGIRL